MDFIPRGLDAAPPPEVHPEFGRPPEIGSRKTFIPGSWDQNGVGDPRVYRSATIDWRVTGEVIQINQKHHFYRVRFETATGAQYECFKF